MLQELFDVKGKNVIITGASSGIGLELAKGFVKLDANVAMIYNSHDIHDLVEQLEKENDSDAKGQKIKCYQCSLSSFESVNSVFNTIAKDFGQIDVCIANAGIAWDKGPILDIEDDAKCVSEWEKVVNVDFNSCFYIARVIGKIFKSQKVENENKKRSLIFTSSMSAHIVNVPQLQACYNACKAGVSHLTKSLAVEWADLNIKVNAVSPGYIGTSLTEKLDPKLKGYWVDHVPMKRMGKPSELLGTYVYLASYASNYTTGADIIVDGGYCCP
ncbi:NAD(P)-binding protein [Hanseniaspora valbyensis NRRL Y-1626]|uniref:NAD(P)-binding protein n=1 Tax=Hanseniaspora valbyensis NRRL Y-1626 TaxID=766949 RepID=A0A1B7THT2_9ASCO|nr:NAD(P)-binding protein [Hanseniaspora valbyensis NRRL Y-1626]